MTLARGSIGGYEYDRMVLLFSMMDGAREVPCAVSASAMDDLEHVPRTPANQREEQFVAIARPDRSVRVAQIPGAGVRGNSSRHHRAQHRLPADLKAPGYMGWPMMALRWPRASAKARPACGAPVLPIASIDCRSSAVRQVAGQCNFK